MRFLLDTPRSPKFRGLLLEDRLKQMTEVFAERLAEEGIHVAAHRERAFERFRSFEAARQAQIYDQFLKRFFIYGQAEIEGISLRDSDSLIRYALKKLGYRQDQGFLSQVSSDDVFEIYCPYFIQLFANLKFMELCSYSIAETVVYEWPELFRRPVQITDALIARAEQVLGGVSDSLIAGVPDHFLEEIFSAERRRFAIQQKIIAPIYDERGEIAAFAATLRAADVTAENIRVLH